MTNQQFPEALAAFLQELDQRRRELDEAREAALRAFGASNPDPLVSPHMFDDMRIAEAAEWLLKRRGRSIAFTELVASLQKGGCEMGENPHKNAKTTITSNSRLCWVDEGTKEEVALAEWRAQKNAA